MSELQVDLCWLIDRVLELERENARLRSRLAIIDGGDRPFDGLSVRVRNALARYQIGSLEALAALHENDILCWNNIGRTSVHEIRAFLKARGMQLAGDRFLSSEPAP